MTEDLSTGKTSRKIREEFGQKQISVEGSCKPFSLGHGKGISQ